MAMCKCRDTGSKRCKWLFSTPDPFRTTSTAPGKQARLDARDPKKNRDEK